MHGTQGARERAIAVQDIEGSSGGVVVVQDGMGGIKGNLAQQTGGGRLRENQIKGAIRDVDGEINPGIPCEVGGRNVQEPSTVEINIAIIKLEHTICELQNRPVGHHGAVCIHCYFTKHIRLVRDIPVRPFVERGASRVVCQRAGPKHLDGVQFEPIQCATVAGGWEEVCKVQTAVWLVQPQAVGAVAACIQGWGGRHHESADVLIERAGPPTAVAILDVELSTGSCGAKEKHVAIPAGA